MRFLVKAQYSAMRKEHTATIVSCLVLLIFVCLFVFVVFLFKALIRQAVHTGPSSKHCYTVTEVGNLWGRRSIFLYHLAFESDYFSLFLATPSFSITNWESGNIAKDRFLWEVPTSFCPPSHHLENSWFVLQPVCSSHSFFPDLSQSVAVFTDCSDWLSEHSCSIADGNS